MSDNENADVTYRRLSYDAEQTVPKPKLSNENLVINELIREYFEYNGYRHALSVFLPGKPATRRRMSGYWGLTRLSLSLSIHRVWAASGQTLRPRIPVERIERFVLCRTRLDRGAQLTVRELLSLF